MSIIILILIAVIIAACIWLYKLIMTEKNNTDEWTEGF